MFFISDGKYELGWKTAWINKIETISGISCTRNVGFLTVQNILLNIKRIGLYILVSFSYGNCHWLAS